MDTKLNQKQTAVLNVLKGADKPMTLAEIGTAIGSPVKSGTTNTLVARGLMKIVGERVVVCPCCGKKTKVNEYSIGQ